MNNLGTAYLQARQMDKAKAIFEKALVANPNVATAHLILADLFMKTDRPAKAREQLETYLKDLPNDPQADPVRQILSRLKTQSTQ